MKKRQTRKSVEEPVPEKFVPKLKQHIRPKTRNQAAYVRAIKGKQITFCLGCAGTGKTFLACAVGAQMLARGLIDKIVLARPMIQCSDTPELGFLPGDVKAKTSEFVAPLTEALEDFFSKSDLNTLTAQDRLRVIPLSVMRGRSIRNSLVIVDECQNATPKQLRMALTRIEQDSKVVLCGDSKQSDIGNSSIQKIAESLSCIDGIEVVYMMPEDNQRAKLINDIERVFEKHWA